MSYITIRNENIITEILKTPLTIGKIQVAKNSAEKPRVKRIISQAYNRGVDIKKIARNHMPKGRSGEAHESIVAILKAPELSSFEELLAQTKQKGEEPFFLLTNRVDYTANLSFIARTAFAAGVNGIIFQGRQEDILNDETVHLSMGAMLRIPLVKMNIFTAIKKCSEKAIKTFALSMEGSTYFDANLQGAVALVLGNEGEGLSDNVVDRCDGKLAIPMREGIDSLNVSTSAALVMYEKVRQDFK
ncbi:hypothetical protein GF360_03970 [candidate division WWE3 bacterium]|nr:hypothetical protein [candidate division WWE3 bacterium]